LADRDENRQKGYVLDDRQKRESERRGCGDPQVDARADRIGDDGRQTAGAEEQSERQAEGVRVEEQPVGQRRRRSFLAHVARVLAPALRAREIVALDNMRAHKVVGVREAIEANGAKVLDRPPYSPEFDPIENSFSKFKSVLERIAARTADALDAAVAHAPAMRHAERMHGMTSPRPAPMQIDRITLGVTARKRPAPRLGRRRPLEKRTLLKNMLELHRRLQLYSDFVPSTLSAEYSCGRRRFDQEHVVGDPARDDRNDALRDQSHVRIIIDQSAIGSPQSDPGHISCGGAAVSLKHRCDVLAIGRPANVPLDHIT